MFKYIFKRDCFLATIAVFLLMGILYLIPINTHVLDPIKLALADFDYNDLAYAKMNKNKYAPTDTNIIIVNIGYGNREAIANMINKIDVQKPKVIGVDILFDDKKDVLADDILRSYFNQNAKIVTAYNLENKINKGYFYGNSLNKGFANFVGEEGGVIRHFAPFIKNKESNQEAFAVMVAKIADLESYNHFLKRDKLTEVINYTRGMHNYLVIDGLALLNEEIDATVFKGKIVLIGYVNTSRFDVEDKHFTPLNEKFSGKSLPDMNGVFIHANIISMLIYNDYIHQVPTWLMWSIAFLLCWLHMALFIKAYLDNHIWFHLVAKVAQLISAICFVYLGLLCFYYFDMQLNMTATLAAIILAVDVLYFYEAFAIWLHQKVGFKTIFKPKHHD